MNHNLSKVEHSFDKTFFEHFQGHNKTIVLEVKFIEKIVSRIHLFCVKQNLYLFKKNSCLLSGGSVVVDFLFMVASIVGVCNCFMFCCTLLYVHSSIAIILMGKRELVALLNVSSWCLVMIERLFLAVPWGCLRFVIVVFPDHTLLLFLNQ